MSYQQWLSLPLPAEASLEDVIAWAEVYRAQNGMKPRLFVSFSGGRTSALMCKLIKEHLSEYFELLFLFANTGREDEDTLRFTNEVDKYLGLNLVWVEAIVHGPDVACTARVVTYQTASRDGEPFEAMTAKYGIPNASFLHCTRETKTNPMHDYVRNIAGWSKGSYHTAIGIRSDEKRRVKDKALAQWIVYPLAHWWLMDKQDVLDFWEPFAWNLAIPERDGNCVDCHKKSDAKLALIYREHPERFIFPIKLDRLYSGVGSNSIKGVRTDEPRKRYRGFMNTLEKLSSFEGVDVSSIVDDESSGGCTESCEPYETEAVCPAPTAKTDAQ